MASEEQSRGKEGQNPSDLQTVSFQWGAILSSIKDQIPSMDSDVSMSDCDDDGELFIFQRDEANLIPDLSEELEQLSSDEADLQKTFMFMRHPREDWNEDLGGPGSPTTERVPLSACKEQTDGDNFGQQNDEKLSQPASARSVLLSNAHKSGEGTSGEIRDKDQSLLAETLPVEAPPVLNINEKERRKLIENQILSKVMLGPSSKDVVHPPPEKNNDSLDRSLKAESKPGTISAEHPRELSLFAFKDIEKWDLDKVLQGLKKPSNDQNWTEEIAFPSIDHETCRALSQARLMGKLEELCLQQSRVFFSHRRRRLAKLPHFNECQGDGRDVPSLASQTNGRSSTPVELQCSPEPPTIYIDLRDTTSQEGTLLTNEKQSSSDSSTEEEDDIKVTSPEHGKPRLREPSRPSRKDCTGKSFLLQQLRNFRRQMAQALTTTQDEERSQSITNPEERAQPKVRRRQCLQRAEMTSMGPTSPESRDRLLLDHVNSMAGSSGELQEESDSKIPIGSPSESSEGKNAGYPRAEEKQKEKQVEEKLKKEKLQEQLERLKPQCSVTGKQPMAEQTPVLFHAEASFLAPIKTLPTPKGPERKTLLLNIGLTSCNHVALHSQHQKPFPETSLPATNIYAAVVAWLLSLVSAAEESKAPFQVLGLQQAWHEEGLALQACIAPAKKVVVQNDSRLRKHRVKEFLPEVSQFHQQISMFLSSTLLSDVIWWKEELANQMKNQHKYPFLPEIPAIPLSCITTVNADPAAMEQAFAMPAGFYWQMVETDEEYFSSSSDIGESRGIDTEVAVTLLFETLLRNPMAVHHILQMILASGLDVCGLRLLYPQYSLLLSSMVPLPSCYTQDKVPRVLALSLRGAKARSVLQDIMGPSDPHLAVVTDCCSMNAIYCKSRADPLAYLPHTDHRVHRELCVWFGGRVCCDQMICGSATLCACDKARPSSLQADPEKDNFHNFASPRLPATLVGTTKGDAILMVSPAVPSRAYGAVITTCTQRGFALQGVKRLRLSPKQVLLLCMAASQEAVFCPTKTWCPPDRSISGDHFVVRSQVHCLALLLRKENARHHVPALLTGLMNGLAEKGFLEEVQSCLCSCVEPEPSLCFHAVPYTKSVLQALGGNFSSVPDPCNVPLDVFCYRIYASHPEMEQIVLLTLCSQEAMKIAGNFLHRILTLGSQKQGQAPVPEESDPQFELLALKWLPRLTRIQAKEITPFEVGDKSWQASIATLMSGPALVCALRRMDAFAGLAEILKTFTLCDSKASTHSCHLQAMMSLTPEMAFRQAVLFFTKKDFVDDPKCRPSLKYLPPPGRHSQLQAWEIQRSHAESLFQYMQGGAPVLCTVLLIKPGIWAHNLARFLRKLDQEKFRLVGMKHIDLNPDDVRALLTPDVQQDPVDVEGHSSYLTSASSLVLCLQRENAVKKLLDLLGPEDPKRAQAISRFLWRAQYGHSKVQNGFYGSMSYCVALRDIKLFFPEGLCGAECPTLEEKEICTVKFDPVVRLEISKQHRLVRQQARRQSQTPEWPHLAMLCQTTCLIFPEILLHGAGRPPYLDILEQLISKDFLVTGVRFTTMSKSLACTISGILNATDCKASVMCSQLIAGPCLVLAAQRDNAVICFDSLLTRDYSQKQAMQDLMQHLLYPKTEKQVPLLAFELRQASDCANRRLWTWDLCLSMLQKVKAILHIQHPTKNKLLQSISKPSRDGAPADPTLFQTTISGIPKQAEELLCCLFDSLTSGSIYQIEIQDS